MNTVGILGLGLIGGSLARALAAQGVRVVGYDRSSDAIRLAEESGVIAESVAEDLEGLEQADTVVLAVPVGAAPALLQRAAARLNPARLITDVGSTKRSICRAAQTLGLGARFAGSHPYAGDHRSGWAAARADLFEGSTVFVCGLPETTGESLSRVRELWTRVGALPHFIDAADHDARLAWTSHLPQFVASATALALADRGLVRSALGPGGRDLTRLAGSNAELWSAIALDNADNLRTALAGLQRELNALDSAIANLDETAVRDALERARRWFNPPTTDSASSLD